MKLSFLFFYGLYPSEYTLFLRDVHWETVGHWYKVGFVEHVNFKFPYGCRDPFALVPSDTEAFSR